LQTSLNGFFADKNFSSGDKWAVYVVEVKSGDYAYSGYTNNEPDPTIAASLIKVFIAGAVYREAAQSQSFTINRDNLARMLRDSDNNAANELITALGGGDLQAGMVKVNAFSKATGFNDTELNRKLAPEQPVSVDNYTSVQDCANALRMIAQGTYVSREASEEIFSWLAANSSWNENKNSKIRAGISAIDANAVIANKTGENAPPAALCIVENDIAIIKSGNVQYVLCVMSNTENSAGAKDTIKQIAGLVHKFFLEMR
jgi:beta-lactamase class A